jgi:hypothetical protein
MGLGGRRGGKLMPARAGRGPARRDHPDVDALRTQGLNLTPEEDVGLARELGNEVAEPQGRTLTIDDDGDGRKGGSDNVTT